MREIVATHLEWVIEYWPDLVEARMPLTTKPLKQTRTISGEEIDLRDAAEHIERYFRNNLAWGESLAPVDVDILQTILDVLVYADDLAAELGPEMLCPILAAPGPGQLDARPWLRYALARLLELPAGVADGWSEWVWPRVERIYKRTAGALAEIYHGQTVKVVCPWCDGRTEDQPVGGAHTWQVEVLPNNQVAIVCHGTNCNPPPEHVTTWLWGKPCWPITAWEKLAQRLQPAS
ncbi:hypothetical protein FXF51_56840 [Nonomuraea sp. PA05]|uniref:hypothetical protein n=1 Tax=Nonomuraea sp. PA05 TaxID=2604466 RepID=UPI0011DB8435|nr:hypothetical protein [Nonomuraea sp. PA05]TYB50249.1 hypothetical protein FXF51_56840 [Nonomuraea sp. PA05]